MDRTGGDPAKNGGDDDDIWLASSSCSAATSHQNDSGEENDEGNKIDRKIGKRLSPLKGKYQKARKVLSDYCIQHKNQ